MATATSVMLSELVNQRNQQTDLFDNNDRAERSEALMGVLDNINSQMGNGTLSLAEEGFIRRGIPRGLGS